MTSLPPNYSSDALDYDLRKAADAAGKKLPAGHPDDDAIGRLRNLLVVDPDRLSDAISKRRYSYADIIFVLGSGPERLSAYPCSKMDSYSGYSISVSNDPSYYGSEVTDAEGEHIAATIQRMIEDVFPGIAVKRWKFVGGKADAVGPDAAVCAEINDWVAANWTAAL